MVQRNPNRVKKRATIEAIGADIAVEAGHSWNTSLHIYSMSITVVSDPARLSYAGRNHATASSDGRDC